MGDSQNVVFSFFGSALDRKPHDERWKYWRPSVALALQEDFPVRRLELIINKPEFRADAEIVARDVQVRSPKTNVNIHELDWENPWDFAEVFAGLTDLVEGYPFAPDEEQYYVHLTTGTHVTQICWFLLIESGWIPARILQTSPDLDQESVPYLGAQGSHYVIDLDLSRYDRIARRFERQTRDAVAFLKDGIMTRNERFNVMIDRIERVALNSAAPVLLMGPTGAGKSRLARRIYELKRARSQVNGPFVEVNCATIRGDGAMSALFGHRKGAFTGAVSDRPGLIKSADKGVLFLDEIAEIGLDEQAMLLKSLEEKRFLPVGSDKEQQSDFQLICGTNRELGRLAVQGKFRQDLLSRINLWSFELPSLRERPEDIEPNLDFELIRVQASVGRLISLNAEARRLFLDFATSPEAVWVGNFRDLAAAVTRMAALADGGRIDRTVVEEEITRLRADWRYEPTETKNPTDRLVVKYLGPQASQIDEFDRVQLAHVLQVCEDSSSLSAAGRRLFAVSRQRKTRPNDTDRLRKYLSRFGIAWGNVKYRS